MKLPSRDGAIIWRCEKCGATLFRVKQGYGERVELPTEASPHGVRYECRYCGHMNIWAPAPEPDRADDRDMVDRG